MSALFPPTPTSRREALFGIGKVIIAAGLSSLVPACDVEIRDFVIDAVKWIPTEALTDIALGIAADSGVDFIDARCHQCGVAIRVTKLTVGVVTALGAFSCPECVALLNVTVIISAYLLKQMNTFGFTHAVGLAKPGGAYTIAKVGPATINYQPTAVQCSAVSAVSLDEQHAMRIDGRNSVSPSKVYYASRISGSPGDKLIHVWRRDGTVTDRLKVKQPSTGDHYSYKTRPEAGLYIVTTETTDGAILDSKAFSVSSKQKTTIMIKAA